MVWVPAASEVVMLAAPPPSLTVPNVLVPSLKVTVPIGIALPLFAETVAVKVIGWPGAACAEDNDTLVAALPTVSEVEPELVEYKVSPT